MEISWQACSEFDLVICGFMYQLPWKVEYISQNHRLWNQGGDCGSGGRPRRWSGIISGIWKIIFKFLAKNGADLCASKVNISAFCRFMKLPIILLSQNLMPGTVKLRYSLWKCNQKPKTCNNTPFILKSMDIAYFPRSKTSISQVADIETENGQKLWKIWGKFYQPRSIWLHWCILGHRNASLLFFCPNP